MMCIKYYLINSSDVLAKHNKRIKNASRYQQHIKCIKQMMCIDEVLVRHEGKKKHVKNV